ncbi:MAG: Unknown protein [uncultured Sulfurovum sp.]|uniref:Uncharacterized protein n=1 Tax=uncultured Sulfurovum sp. TaxID=269237 RepID=A0A6S6T925_9BACT|nr:MAG: Unknown protein [uncultured Sulfurovum sp.]
MKNFIILTIVFLTFANANVQIVTSKSCKLESISKSDVKKLFMLKKTEIDKEKIKVIDSTNKELYNDFIVTYLNKSVRKIKTYWVRMLFTGKKIPPKKLSLEDLKKLDDKETCHFAYVAKENDMPKEWKIIKIK